MNVGENAALMAGIDLDNIETLIEWKSNNSEIITVNEGVVPTTKS